MKWQCFSLIDNTSPSLYLMACKIGYSKPRKVNDLEKVLWSFKNVQNITGPTIKHLKMSKVLLAPLLKPFNSRNSTNPLVNLNFHFVVVVVVVVVDITCTEYFISVFLSRFIKIFENLWKWFEFIHYSFSVNNTCVLTLHLYAHAIAIKTGVCCIYAYIYIYIYSIFVGDSRDIRRMYFSNFSLEKYILVKM